MPPRIDHQAVVELTRELVRIPSVNQPEVGSTELEAALAVADAMRSFGWEPHLEEVAPGRPNVMAVLEGGTPGPTLLFEGHSDVVTPGDLSEWSHDPFGGELVDGRVYGRGAADMKGGVAAMLHAAAAVADRGPFPGRIVVAVLCDEEEMMIGAKHFVAAGHAATVDAAIVCEPEAGEVCTTQKGALRLRIDAKGKMAHGAMPHQGRNPLQALARLQLALADLEEELYDEFGAHPDLGAAYLTPTHAAGGSAAQMNVIPREAVLLVDTRTIPGIEHPTLVARIESAAAAIAADTGVWFGVGVIDDRPPTVTPIDHPIVRAVANAHEAVTGEKPRYGGVPGTTDGTILWRDAGVPVVVYGPGGKWIAHQADEYVEVSDLLTAAEVYVVAALEFLGA